MKPLILAGYNAVNKWRELMGPTKISRLGMHVDVIVVTTPKGEYTHIRQCTPACVPTNMLTILK